MRALPPAARPQGAREARARQAPCRAHRAPAQSDENKGKKPMSIAIRRVVTGHDAQGRAKVLIDEQVKNVFSHRPGARYSVIWSSDTLPADNDGSDDPSGKKIGTTIANGSVFRVVSFEPGVAPRNHRTDSIDYAVVISGEIDM